MLHPYYYELTHPSYPDHVFNLPLEPSLPPSLDTPSSGALTTSHPLTFISTPKALLSMANTISSTTELAVDLEHHSYRSYKGFLALMQISTRQGDFVVDLLVPEVREGLRQAKDKSVRNSEEARMASEAGEIIARVFADPSVIKVRLILFSHTKSLFDISPGFYLRSSMVQSRTSCGSSKTSTFLLLVYLIHFTRRNCWVCACSCILSFRQFTFTGALEFPKHSLAYLLETYCDFVPDKRYQLADWRIR